MKRFLEKVCLYAMLAMIVFCVVDETWVAIVFTLSGWLFVVVNNGDSK